MKLPKFETLYCLYDPFALPWRAKIGISIDHEIRKGQVEQSIKQEHGISLNLRRFGVPVLFARKNERLAHWIFKKMKYTGVWNSNGGQEWFWALNILSFVLCWALMSYYGIEAAKWKAFFFLVLPIPVDHILVISILFLVQWAVLLGSLYGAAYFLFA